MLHVTRMNEESACRVGRMINAPTTPSSLIPWGNSSSTFSNEANVLHQQFRVKSSLCFETKSKIPGGTLCANACSNLVKSTKITKKEIKQISADSFEKDDDTTMMNRIPEAGNQENSSGIPFEDLPHDIASLIFSFAYDSTSKFVIFRRRHGFFDSIFYLSKAMQGAAINFLRNRIKNVERSDIPIVCKYGSKPACINLKLGSNTDQAVFLHMLRKCDLSVLTRLELDASQISRGDETLKSRHILKSLCIKAVEYEKIQSLTSAEFELSVAGVIQSKAKALKGLTINSMTGMLPFFRTIETLTIDGYYQSWEELEKTLLHMPNLRKISLEYGLINTISSESIEEVKIKNNMRTSKILCPNLKELNISLKLSCLQTEIDDLIPQSVERLSLKLSNGGTNTICPTIQLLSTRIKGLHQLKSLQLSDNGFHQDFMFPIWSDTLKQIDISLASENFQVKECICPSLEKFIFACKLGCTRENLFSSKCPPNIVKMISGDALRPVKKFTKADFTTPPHDMPKKILHTFHESDRKFHKLVVPTTCIIVIEVEYVIVSAGLDSYSQSSCDHIGGVPSVTTHPWHRERSHAKTFRKTRGLLSSLPFE